MKAISAMLLILGLAIFIHQKHGMIHFALRPWSLLVVGVSLLAICVAMGWRNVLNAFKGRDQEAGRRIIQTLACTGVITVTFGIARICQNLNNTDNIGPIAMFCLATVIQLTLVSLFLVLNAKKTPSEEKT